ncbi:MAG: ATP-binding protein [Armatimonadetes bacterium]|nr:ATP-binding protein [Armatimonadota bacterium]
MTSSELLQGVQELRVGSEFRNSHRVREFVRGAARECNLGDEAVADLALAVTEVFNNAVEHAHRFEADRQIIVRVHPRPEAIQVDIVDEGPGFAPDEASLRAPATPTQRGLGLFLARQLVDRISFTRGPGTTVHLLKTAC